ncbi:MAG: hypothetical protein M3342_13875 [Bacteroidota bacterium]|nr:hypothetical protein [Bacteroidota bacterium]
MHPLDKAFLHDGGIQGGNDTVDRIVRRNAVGQFNVVAQPIHLFLAVGLDFLPLITAAQNSRQRQKENVDELMFFRALHPRIGYVAEVFDKSLHRENNFPKVLFPFSNLFNLDAFALTMAIQQRSFIKPGGSKETIIENEHFVR